MMNFIKIIKILMLLVVVTVFFQSCNKDETIAAGEKPTIELDNADGIYTVKVGQPLIVSPKFSNAADADIEWAIDGEVIAHGSMLNYTWDTAGTYYIMISATNDVGTVREEIRIEVMALTPPVISMSLPEGGLKVMTGVTYTLTPDIQHADMEGFTIAWSVNGEKVSDEVSYSFSSTVTGTFHVKIEASNIDGSTVKEFDIEVVNEMPRGVRFLPASYFVTSTDRYTFAGRPVCLTPVVSDFTAPKYRWEIDGKADGSTAEMLKFTPEQPGEYTVKVFVSDGGSKSSRMLSRNIEESSEYTAQVKIICVNASEYDRRRAASPTSNAYGNKVYEWVPAPGQFINGQEMNGAEKTHESAMQWAADRLNNRQYVSLGAFGGYIIVGFDHSIDAASAKACDFAIEGNAFNSAAGGSNEPGIVWVMQDVNGNGLPDDEWYQLRGSEFDAPTTIKNYAVTYYRPESAGMSVNWTDNRGEKGSVDYLEAFHKQPSYYPEWVPADSYTLYGTALKARNFQDASTGYWSNPPYDWGYADNIGSDAVTIGTDGGQFTGFRLANAVLADGSAVNLKYIDFVKVQCGVQTKSGWIGELSTEVFGFVDPNLVK